jgi:K+/H+ antiporter YhaU regulatory subunit KhtT
MIDNTSVAVEVELARKSTARLSAILELHAMARARKNRRRHLWCGSTRTCRRVEQLAEPHGLTIACGRIWVQTFACGSGSIGSRGEHLDVRQQTRQSVVAVIRRV